MIYFTQKMIYREDLADNHDFLYVFGDNLERTGYGGQAREMRGMPNAFGIATKRKAAHGSEDCYFHDHEQDAWDAVNEDINKLLKEVNSGKWAALVLPHAGIGTGLALLEEKAPELLEHILCKIVDISKAAVAAEYKNRET